MQYLVELYAERRIRIYARNPWFLLRALRTGLFVALG